MRFSNTVNTGHEMSFFMFRLLSNRHRRISIHESPKAI